MGRTMTPCATHELGMGHHDLDRLVASVDLDLDAINFITEALYAYAPTDEYTKDWMKLQLQCQPKPIWQAYFRGGKMSEPEATYPR